MPYKVRPCKSCDGKRWGNSSWCFQHHKERERAKREATKQKRLARKLASKKHQQSELKKWKAKCWKLMSEWVRRKDADEFGLVTCFTCSERLHWKQMDCGHHFHRRLDLDPRNLRPQETRCNRFLHGNLGVYAKRLIEENGLEWYQKLELDANTHKGYIDINEMKRIHQDLSEKLAKLETRTL